MAPLSAQTSQAAKNRHSKLDSHVLRWWIKLAYGEVQCLPEPSRGRQLDSVGRSRRKKSCISGREEEDIFLLEVEHWLDSASRQAVASLSLSVDFPFLPLQRIVVKTTWGSCFHAEFTVTLACALAFHAWCVDRSFVSGPESRYLQTPMLCLGSFLACLLWDAGAGMREAVTGAGAPYVHPFTLPMKPHLASLDCLLFSSGFWFTPSCGCTKYNRFQSFIRIEINCSSWFGHLSFVSLNKKNQCWASLGFQTFCRSLGSIWSLATQWAKVPFLASDPISSFHILERLSHHSSDIIIMSWVLLLEDSAYCQGESSYIIFLCSRGYLFVIKGCFKLSDRCLGSAWDTVLCYFEGETSVSPLSTSGQSSVSLGQTHKFALYCRWENSFLQTSLSKFFRWRKLIP